MDAPQPRPAPLAALRRHVARAGLAAAVVLAVINVTDAARRAPVPPLVASAGTPDTVVRMERRLEPLRRALERRGVRGVVGYVGDAPGARTLDDLQAVVDYFQAQFALAPCVLDLETARSEWAVTNLRATRIAERRPAGFVVAEDFGAGVLLLRKAAP